MTKEVEYCDIHADLVDVADDMIKKGHRRRPVLDHGKLVGQITCRQLLRVVSEFNRRAIPLYSSNY
jgi:CBS domain-containing protein